MTLIFYTKSLCNAHVTANICPSIDDSVQQVQVHIEYDGVVHCATVQPFEGVEWPGALNINHETGKVELTLRKKTRNVWRELGALEQSSRTSNEEDASRRYDYVVGANTRLNHNTHVLSLRARDRRLQLCPLGKHVRVFRDPGV